MLVEYEPGGFPPALTHPNSALIYATVLEGAIRSQVNNGPVTTYRAGESFSEHPVDHHGVSETRAPRTPRGKPAGSVGDCSMTGGTPAIRTALAT